MFTSITSKWKTIALFSFRNFVFFSKNRQQTLHTNSYWIRHTTLRTPEPGSGYFQVIFGLVYFNIAVVLWKFRFSGLRLLLYGSLQQNFLNWYTCLFVWCLLNLQVAIFEIFWRNLTHWPVLSQEWALLNIYKFIYLLQYSKFVDKNG